MLADTIVAAALELEGLSFGADPDRACELLFPFDSRAVARDNLAGDLRATPPRKPHSICGHVGWSSLRRGGASGVLRALGGRDFLLEPYARHGGLAIARLVQLAQEQGLWHTSLAQSDIEASDLVVIGATGVLRAAFGGDEHVAIITGDDESIDGGQPDPKNGGHPTAVLLRRRVLEQRGRELWMRPIDGLGGATRRLQGWFKAGKLASHDVVWPVYLSGVAPFP